MEIQNIDELLPTIENPSLPVCENILAPKHPFRLLVIGASGSGKSNCVMNLITNYLNFDRIIFYARDTSEDKYQYLMSFFEEIEQQIYEKSLKRYNKMKPENRPKEEPKLFKIAEFYENPNPEDIISSNDLNPDIRNCIVFDDFVSSGKSAHKPIIDLFIRSRKRNCSVIYISQSFYSIPKDIRLNASHMILFNVTSKRELLEIQKTLAYRVDKDTFLELFRCINNEPYQFMYIDAAAKDLSMHIRKNFDGLMNIGACVKSGIIKNK